MCPRRSFLFLALLVVSCGVAESDVSAVDDGTETADSLSASVPLGSTLETTGNLNLRAGPSTSNTVRTVMPLGAQVTTINTTSPTGAFYNVRYGTTEGWASGAYLKLVSSGTTTPPQGCTEPHSCSADGMSRVQCGAAESCANGCLRGTDAVCLGGSYTLSCPGSYGTQKSTSGSYYLTAFGCWKDASGGIHTDSGDNCIPSCLSQARSSGLCLPGDTGPACEERVTWYTADGARFGCLARLKVTNPANGKSVIAVALDYGPSCSVERSVSSPVLDTSGRIDRYLFGADMGAVDRAKVHVVEVDRSTPLGPVP